MKWKYVKENDVLARQWFVKWWDKFSHTQDVIDNVTQDFPVNTHNTISPVAQVKAPASAYPPIQATRSTTSTKSKKKKSTYNGLSKTTLIALLKQSWKDEEEATNANSEEEEDNQESKASLEISIANNDDPCYPCNQELFGHHIVTTLDLAED